MLIIINFGDQTTVIQVYSPYGEASNICKLANL